MDNQPASLADPTLLEKIDKFFELGIGDYVALPQLLVVGDQSSGKSSVLQGLTGLPYPRDSGLCTRFATQITFRRSLTTKIAVSIIPAENASPAYSDKLRAWRKDDLVALQLQTFAEILKEVHELLGLGQAKDGGNKKTFADDVLKIEICGPNQEHLSIIDVPGIFKKTTPGVTTKTDMTMVRNMVTNYMRNPRSVILAVIPANVDIATQEILEMAVDVDAKGERTLGVLTKPDLVDKGAESAIISILEGESHFLNLGWCVVRNHGQQALVHSLSDAAVEDRNAKEEAFFKNQQPWSDVSKDRVGIEALRIRLVEILAEMIKREFPRVKAEINAKLKFCIRQRDALGPSRATRDLQYKFLLDLATEYQRVTSHALKADYAEHNLFNVYPTLRLATIIVDRNAVFSDDVARIGHAMAFDKHKDPNENLSSQSSFQAPSFGNSSLPSGTFSFTKTIPISTTTTKATVLPTNGVEGFGSDRKSVRYKKNYTDLEDLMEDSRMIRVPKVFGIKQWLREIYKNSRGFEVGIFGASLLPIAFKEQSANWEALALGFVEDIVSLVHAFTVDLLAGICKDPRARQGLYSVLFDHLTDRYKKSIDHTKFLLTVERSGTPMTTNHYFADNLDKSRAIRQRASAEKLASSMNTTGDGKAPAINHQATFTSSNSEYAIDDLHDILHAYYKVARKRFVDAVCMQASDYFLVNGQDAPIKVFSPKFVSELTDEQLETIAGEEMGAKRKRDDLSRKIENLEAGRKIAVS